MFIYTPPSRVVCVQLSGCPVLVKNEVCPCVCVCTQREMYVQYGDVGHVECDGSWSSCVGRLECEKNDAKRLCYKSSRTPMDATRR